MVEIKMWLQAKVKNASGHACADPGTWIPQHDHAACRHIFAQEAFDVGPRPDKPETIIERLRDFAADDNIRAREADASARVCISLHDDEAACASIGETFPNGAVDQF